MATTVNEGLQLGRLLATVRSQFERELREVLARDAEALVTEAVAKLSGEVRWRAEMFHEPRDMRDRLVVEVLDKRKLPVEE